MGLLGLKREDVEAFARDLVSKREVHDVFARQTAPASAADPQSGAFGWSDILGLLGLKRDDAEALLSRDEAGIYARILPRYVLFMCTTVLILTTQRCFSLRVKPGRKSSKSAGAVAPLYVLFGMMLHSGFR